MTATTTSVAAPKNLAHVTPTGFMPVNAKERQQGDCDDGAPVVNAVKPVYPAPGGTMSLMPLFVLPCHEANILRLLPQLPLGIEHGGTSETINVQPVSVHCLQRAFHGGSSLVFVLCAVTYRAGRSRVIRALRM